MFQLINALGDGEWGGGMLGLECYCLRVTVEGFTVRLNKKKLICTNGKNKALSNCNILAIRSLQYMFEEMTKLD